MKLHLRKFIISGLVIGYLSSLIFYSLIMLAFGNTIIGVEGTRVEPYSLSDLRTSHILMGVRASLGLLKNTDFLIITAGFILAGMLLSGVTYFIWKKIKQ